MFAFRKSTRLAQRLDGSLERHAGPGRFRILSRGLCRHTRFSFPEDLPRAERRRALDLRVTAWAPFTEPRYAAVWQGAGAKVWAWEGAGTPADADRLTPVPETLLRPAGQDGARLVTCLDGVEGQVWQQGRLQASRWWPGPPDPADWLSFCRAGRLPEAGACRPEPVELGWSDRPWPGFEQPGGGTLLGGLPPSRLAAAAIMLLLLPPAWQVGQLAGLRAEAAAVDRQIAAEGQGDRDLRRARGEALALRQRVALLDGLMPYPHQAEVMILVLNALPRGTQLQAWTFDRGQLSLLLRTADTADVLQYVRAVQAVRVLGDVQLEPTTPAGTVGLRARVIERAAPAKETP